MGDASSPRVSTLLADTPAFAGGGETSRRNRAIAHGRTVAETLAVLPTVALGDAPSDAHAVVDTLASRVSRQ